MRCQSIFHKCLVHQRRTLKPTLSPALTVYVAVLPAKIVAVHQLTGQRRVVAVRVLASVRILATNRLSVDNQAVADVTHWHKGRKQREESNCLDLFEEL